MRRFSKRNQLVTLSDINVTPLLDLAFVLLIIFIIISPSLRSVEEQAIPLNLPKGGAPSATLDARDILVVSVDPQGNYALANRPMSLPEIQNILITGARVNPNLIVAVRGDGAAQYRHVAAILSTCQEYGIACNLRTRPAANP